MSLEQGWEENDEAAQGLEQNKTVMLSFIKVRRLCSAVIRDIVEEIDVVPR